MHPPYDTRIFVKECQSLATEGYDVVLIHIGQESTVRDGVRIIGVALRPHNRIDRILRGSLAILRAALRTKSKCFHVHDPELLPAALFLSALRKKVIYDAHEDLPAQMLTKPYVRKGLRRVSSVLVGSLELTLSLGLHGVVAANPAIARRFRRRQVALVQNYPAIQEFSTHQPDREHKTSNAVYVGGLTRIRGVEEMILAIQLVPEKLELRLLLIGEFESDELRRSAASLPGWDRVDHLGWQGRNSVVGCLARSRVGLALFQPVPHHIESRPNKIFEYMAAGLPVVASDFPAWREILEKHRCGLLVEPTDASAISDALKWLLEHTQEAEAMGERGRAAVTSSYNWSPEFQKMLLLYEKIFP